MRCAKGVDIVLMGKALHVCDDHDGTKELLSMRVESSPPTSAADGVASCGRCGAATWLSPSGREILERRGMSVVCDGCAAGDPVVEAAGPPIITTATLREIMGHVSVHGWWT